MGENLRSQPFFNSIYVRLLLLPLGAAASAFSDNSLRVQDNDPLTTIWPIAGSTNVASSKALHFLRRTHRRVRCSIYVLQRLPRCTCIYVKYVLLCWSATVSPSLLLRGRTFEVPFWGPEPAITTRKHNRNKISVPHQPQHQNKGSCGACMISIPSLLFSLCLSCKPRINNSN